MWCEGIECVTVVKMHKNIIVSITASFQKKVAQTRWQLLWHFIDSLYILYTHIITKVDELEMIRGD